MGETQKFPDRSTVILPLFIVITPKCAACNNEKMVYNVFKSR